VITTKPGTFAAQLAGLMAARRAISTAQRRESRLSWWATHAVWTVVGTALVVGGFLFGVTEAGARGDEQARVAVFFLLGTLTGAGYLVLIDFRPAGHMLGEARDRLPLSHWRSATLRCAEEVVHPSTMFVIAHGFAPFLGLAVRGDSWLNGWGWLTLVALIAFALVGRAGVSAVKAWVLRPTKGTAEAILRVGFSVVLLTVPVWAGGIIRQFSTQRLDIFSVDGLGRANQSSGPVLVLAGTVSLAWFAIWARTWRGWNLHLPDVGKLRLTPAGSTFQSRYTRLRMAQMMAVRASRSTSYQQAALLVGVVGVLTLWVPAPGVVPLMVGIGFISPLLSFFNLYGLDGSYFTLWLATGVTRSEWTSARQIFAVTYLWAFSYAGLALLTATGALSHHAAAILAPMPAGASALAVALGPRISAIVMTPAEHLDGTRRPGSARSLIAIVAGAFVTALVASATIALSLVAPWAPWAGVFALWIVVAAARPWRIAWSAPFRLRLAMSLRG